MLTIGARPVACRRGSASNPQNVQSRSKGSNGGDCRFSIVCSIKSNVTCDSSQCYESRRRAFRAEGRFVSSHFAMDAEPNGPSPIAVDFRISEAGAAGNRAATLFGETRRRQAQHRDHDENDCAGGNLTDDVAAQVLERTARVSAAI
jgi:hypothetical protein